MGSLHGCIIRFLRIPGGRCRRPHFGAQPPGSIQTCCVRSGMHKAYGAAMCMLPLHPHLSVGIIQIAGHRKSPRGRRARTSTRPYFQLPYGAALVRRRPLVNGLVHVQELSLLSVQPCKSASKAGKDGTMICGNCQQHAATPTRAGKQRDSPCNPPLPAVKGQPGCTRPTRLKPPPAAHSGCLRNPSSPL